MDVMEGSVDMQDATKGPGMIHFHGSYLDKPWVRGCTQTTRQLWTSIASEVPDKWRKFKDLMVTLKQSEAKHENVSALDKSSSALTSFKASNIRCGG